MSEQDQGRPAGELFYRDSQLTDVSFPKRTIELIVIPYDTEALVGWDGRMVTETIARGAFDGVEKRPGRIRVNRDHVLERTVGKALSLYPRRDEGLVARIRIADTDRGNETLTLAAEGCLDASAAFRPMPTVKDGLRWNGPNAYTVMKAWLGHIALTPEPAYETARVLSVRHATNATPAPMSATPNLDRWRAQQREDRLRSVAERL